MNKEQRDAYSFDAEALMAQYPDMGTYSGCRDLVNDAYRKGLAAGRAPLSDAAPQEPRLPVNTPLYQYPEDSPTFAAMAAAPAAQPATPDAGSTDLKLPELPEPDWIMAERPPGQAWKLPGAYSAKTVQERDRQIVELCARVAAKVRKGVFPEDAILALLKTEEVHLTARSGLPPEKEQKQPDSVHLTAPGPMEASTWQPIETAPKDGTLVMLAARKGVWVGKYLPVYQSGFKPGNPWSSMLLNHDHMAERYTRPTHWRPLPPAPESESGGSIGAIGRDAKEGQSDGKEGQRDAKEDAE